jgi:hypothetical protein
MRFAIGSAAILFGLCAAVFASAQVPDDLAAKKDFKSFRASSTDPAGHNGDARPIAPGQTLLLADVNGAGRFTHLWCTIAARSDDHLRELVFRMYWDGSDTPAVECPVGDFFAQGPGKYVEYVSAPVSVGGQMALNCYWPMPFKTHARITVTNEGSKRVDAFYWNFDYRIQKHADRDIRYFHTQYRNFFPAPVGHALNICDVKGAGQYVGTIVSVLCNSNGWWGEGNDMWTIDGDKKKTITGTGSEDYFCGAWDFGHAFETPYFGVTYYDNASKGGEKRGIYNTVYRWHIQDPVVFTTSLLMELEHGSGGGNEDRRPFTNNYTTVGLYYVDHPQADMPAINHLSDRIPTLIPLPTR